MYDYVINRTCHVTDYINMEACGDQVQAVIFTFLGKNELYRYCAVSVLPDI